ncbi:MAG: glycosyltransferase family 39 protein [Bacteroidota bacterium]
MTKLKGSQGVVSIIKSRRTELLALVLCILPVMFINVGPYHDWGGDFAMYIQQAINLVEGRPHGETHYVFNPYIPLLSPPSYGVGFPLLLAPAYWLFGNEIVPFVTTINLFYLGFFILIFKYTRREFNFFESFIITVGLAFTPQLLTFKGEILSDIPFAFFIALALYIYPIAKKRSSLVLFGAVGLIIGYSMLIRSIGAALLLAFMIDQGFDFLKSWGRNRKDTLDFLSKTGVLSMTTLGLYLMVGVVLFPAKQDGFSFFSDFFFTEPLGDQIRKGLEYSFLRTDQTFTTDAGKWQFLSYLNRSVIICMLVMGMAIKVTGRFNHADYFFLIYMTVLILYPVFSQGFRYMLPLLPIGCGYVLTGISSLRFKKKPIKPLVYSLFALGIYYGYKHEVEMVEETYPRWYKGSRTAEAVEVFSVIKNTSTEDEVIIFNKPRVVGLYTARDSYALNPHSDSLELKKQLEELKWDYILTCIELNDSIYRAVIRNNQYPTKKVFENARFTLHERLE